MRKYMTTSKAQGFNDFVKKAGIVKDLASLGYDVGKGSAKLGINTGMAVGSGIINDFKKAGKVRRIMYTGLAGAGASKLYSSYKNPDGTARKAYVAYLRSRYLPGGYLKSMAEGLSSIKRSIKRMAGYENFRDNYRY